MKQKARENEKLSTDVSVGVTCENGVVVTYSRSNGIPSNVLFNQ